MSKEELQKSKEQLEEEKRAILSQRIQPLSIDNMDTAKLLEKAKELYEHTRRLVGDKYDLEQRFKRQQYDVSSETRIKLALHVVLHKDPSFRVLCKFIRVKP